MAHSYTGQSIAIDGNELTMLRTTLETWCRENRVDIAASEAETAAVELMDWYQFGMTHPDQLIELLRRRSLAERLKPAGLHS